MVDLSWINLVLQDKVLQNKIRIPAVERVKLACKRQGEEYCP